MANKTVLKWAGSKVRIIEQLRPHLPKARRLVEPFAGSCAVMMNTDYERYLIADANPDLINLYLIVQSLPIRFIPTAEYYFETFNQEKSYYDIRCKFNATKDGMTSQEMAVNFLYLNRHCYNGLCRYSKRTGFNVPFGHYKKVYFPKEEIIALAVKSQEALITCLEWQETLTLVEDGDGIYCDPPYMGGHECFTRYHTAGFTDADHEALAMVLKEMNDSRGHPVTVSNSPQAKTLYADLGFIVHEIEAPRTIAANGCRKPAKEIIAVLAG